MFMNWSDTNTSSVAEKGRTRNPSNKSATAKLAIRMCVGPRRFELKRTAAKMSKFPPIVSKTMIVRATASIINVQSISSPLGRESVGLIEPEPMVDSVTSQSDDESDSVEIIRILSFSDELYISIAMSGPIEGSNYKKTPGSLRLTLTFELVNNGKNEFIFFGDEAKR